MKRLVLLIVVLFVTRATFAQYRIPLPHRKDPSQNSSSNSTSSKKANSSTENSSQTRSFADRIYFAGGGGFGYGTNIGGLRYKYYSLFPTIGYRIKPELLVGLNVSYSRYTFPDVISSPSYYDQIGYAPFVRYYLQQLFFQLEYDKISSSTLDNQPRKYYDRFLVGVGYAQPLGKRSAINAVGLYDLMYQQNGVFQSPFVFRVFFSY